MSPSTIAGRGLTAVVAIMTFLCALLLGAVFLVERAAGAWGSGALTEITVTVLVDDSEPVEARLAQVADILAAAEGVSDPRILPLSDSRSLLEPWLGDGANLALLPVPRLVTATRTGAFDGAALKARIAAVPGASLDDHTTWSDRLSRLAAQAFTAVALVLVLIVVATGNAVVFATRSTIAANATTMEVLHVLGADEGFIVRAFRQRFLRLGLAGALIGAGVAAALFAVLEAGVLFGLIGSAQSRALFGEPRIGLAGFGAIAMIAATLAVLVALTATRVVRAHLARLGP